MSSLLIAGPCRLDDLAGRSGLIGGSGGYAAIAAAPLLHTQLWSRAGSAYAGRLSEILSKRGIELSGLDSTTGETGGTPVLPELQPSEAGDLSAALLIDLPTSELSRAVAVLDGLEGRLLRVVAPHADEESAARGAEVLITSAPAEDPVAYGQSLQAAGATAVLLCAGAAGGLILYKNKTATWPALPQPASGHPAARAIFAGCLAAQLAEHGHLDFRGLKRFSWLASGVVAACLKGPGPLPLLALDRSAYQQAFLRLRRTCKP